MRMRLFPLAAELVAAACAGADSKNGGPQVATDAPKADAPSAAGKHDWPQWRGPDRTNVNTETGLLQEWPKDGPPLAWAVKGMGTGFSTPSVAAGRIFLMGNRDGDECVIALRESDGGLLWSQRIGPAGGAGGFEGPRCTPTVDGDRVFALGVTGELVCLKVENGDEVWHQSLTKDYKARVPGWGYCESPLVDG